MKKIPYAVAVAKQAEVLDRNRPELAAAARSFADRVAPDAVIGVMGIGASYYAGLSALRELWKLGRRAILVDAGQLWEDPEVSVADAYLAISASGESRETVQAIRALRDAGKPVLVAAVMAEDTERLGSISDQSIPCADPEDSVPATVSYMGTLQALGFLVAALGSEDLSALERRWAAVPAAIDALFTELEAPADAVVDRFQHTTAFDFVGDKDSLGSAAEGALLLREAPGSRPPGSTRAPTCMARWSLCRATEGSCSSATPVRTGCGSSPVRRPRSTVRGWSSPTRRRTTSTCLSSSSQTSAAGSSAPRSRWRRCRSSRAAWPSALTGRAGSSATRRTS